MKNESIASPEVSVQWFTAYDQSGQSHRHGENLGQFADRMEKLGYVCVCPLQPNPFFVDLKLKIEDRIKQLNEADAGFCRDRWDESKAIEIRIMAREASNKVTFARQELQAMLKLIL